VLPPPPTEPVLTALPFTNNDVKYPDVPLKELRNVAPAIPTSELLKVAGPTKEAVLLTLKLLEAVTLPFNVIVGALPTRLAELDSKIPVVLAKVPIAT